MSFLQAQDGFNPQQSPPVPVAPRPELARRFLQSLAGAEPITFQTLPEAEPRRR
ncbi:MAG: hypothetical protein HQL82_17090, partial [Magnetococcales bacterium]|nr:hypothetical protein [Magnetococcales bacterium]